MKGLCSNYHVYGFEHFEQGHIASQNRRKTARTFDFLNIFGKNARKEWKISDSPLDIYVNSSKIKTCHGYLEK